MLKQIVIWILAADGALLVLWCLFGRLLLPQTETVTLLPLSGEAGGAEQALRCRKWLEDSGLVRGRLLLVDCGLSQTGKKTVELLLRGRPEIQFCAEAELPRLWKREQ